MFQIGGYDFVNLKDLRNLKAITIALTHQWQIIYCCKLLTVYIFSFTSSYFNFDIKAAFIYHQSQFTGNF